MFLSTDAGAMRINRVRAGACSLVLLAAMLAAPASGPAGAATPTPFDTPQPGLRAGAPGGPCPGTIEVRVGNGPVTCTHGPDPAPPGVDITRSRLPLPVSDRRGAARAEGPSALAPSICTGDGSDGARVQLVYARPTGLPDRYDAFADSFQTWAAVIDTGVIDSAAETGGVRRIRFVHDATCTPTISRVVVSTAAILEWGTFANQIRELHPMRPDRRFLVWMDANQYCGIGEFFGDDRFGAQNLDNGPASLVSRVDSGCWGNPGELAEGHELFHTLGAVQHSAPHATGGAHCSDEVDRMCGVDGTGVVLTTPCPTRHENLFDCNHDDYFHTNPAPGSYLATHWNTANSRFLAQPPAAPTNVRAVAGEASATVTWTAPDGLGSPVTGYQVTPILDGVPGPEEPLPATATTHTMTGLPDSTRASFTVAATNGLGTGLPSAPSAAVVATDGSRFHSLAPARILDTRTGNGAPSARVLNGATLDVQVTGRQGVPVTGVSAVVLNVTATEPWFGGFLTVWPTGETRPLASNLNVVFDQTVANLVTVKVGVDGKVSLYNGAGVVHLVADVAGWYGPSGAVDGSRYHSVAPARVLDTRTGNGAPAARVASPASIDVQVAGRGGVPATGASAVVLNVTVTEPMVGGFLTAWPTGDVRPLASNLNFLPLQTVPNLVTVKMGSAGKVSLFTSAGGGGAHLVADVAGWFGPDGEATGARYHPVVPARVLDTRAANGAPTAAVAASGTLDVQVTGRSGVPPSGVSAVIVNVTVVDPIGLGFLTTWPTGETRPLASNLNFAAGRTTPNLVVAKVGAGGKVSLYNGSGGTAHLVADVAGWYGPG
ncbi:MAG: fibronectin type III domain-containing protein [Acidimicrobiales bacterium]